MALINCPVCGKPVSDRGDDCVYCGSSLTEPVVVCPRCGNKQSKGSESCMMCDCPLNVEMITCPECEYYMPAGSKRCENCGCPLAEDKPKQTVQANISPQYTYPVAEEYTPVPAANNSEALRKNIKKYMILSDVSLLFAGSFIIRTFVFVVLRCFDIMGLPPLFHRIVWILWGYNPWAMSFSYVVLIPSVAALAMVGLFAFFRKKAKKLNAELEQNLNK